MPGTLAANYCPEGCYWPCEHRAPGAAGSGRGGWTLGPNPGDDPEELALEEWQLHSIDGIPYSRSIPTLKFCSECGESFADSTEHSREHERLRQLRDDLR